MLAGLIQISKQQIRFKISKQDRIGIKEILFNSIIAGNAYSVCRVSHMKRSDLVAASYGTAICRSTSSIEQRRC